VIGLNPFKSFGSHVELLKALCSLDDLGGLCSSLTVVFLSPILTSILPFNLLISFSYSVFVHLCTSFSYILSFLSLILLSLHPLTHIYTGGRITADHIDNFANLLPTEAELKRIDKIAGSKHPAELFLQTVMLFYPQLPRRLSCFAACLNFSDNCTLALARCRRLIDACNQVKPPSYCLLPLHFLHF
jgi:hypothetical protein